MGDNSNTTHCKSAEQAGATGGAAPVATAQMLNRAIAMHQHGQLGEAKGIYEQVLARQPGHPDALQFLGILLHQEGQPGGAELIRQAIASKPDIASYHNNLAKVLEEAGDLVAAARSYREALRLEPKDADGQYNMGVILQKLGRPAEAEVCFRNAARLKPGEFDYHYNLAIVLRDCGRLEEAVREYAEAARLRPEFVEVHEVLGRVHMMLGNVEAAISAYHRALELKPDANEIRRLLASALRQLAPAGYQPELEEDLKACMDVAAVDSQFLARLIARQLIHKYRINDRLDTDPAAALAQLGADPLLHTLLRRCVNVDAGLERALTALRRDHLLAYRETEAIPPAEIAQIVALGLQGLNNEYVLNESTDETATIETLTTCCGALIEQDSKPAPALEALLLLLAMYRPLYALACAPALGAVAPAAWSEPVGALVARTLKEPREEEAIAPTLAALGAVEDATSRAVRAQYEEHPYPRWVSLPHMEQIDLAERLQRAFPHFRPPAFLNGPTRMLVVGCGTGREPLSIALACADIEIVALDLSRRSLAYAVRRARELGVENVRFVHGDLLGLTRLGERFHVIQCAGVLHHMAEPLRGWRVLTEQLVPGGLMKIGLYSERARQAVVAARERIRQQGLTPVTRDIKAFRTRILHGQEPTLTELAESEDLYTLSECRDLLFHAHECRFTLPQVRQALDTLGLSFIGFELPLPQIAPRYRAMYPEDAPMTDLTSWERFENDNPHAFEGMYVFWCQKA